MKTLQLKIRYALRLFLILFLSSLFSLCLSTQGIDKENMLMVYMIGIMLTSACTEGYLYGALSSILSVMIFNYFFTFPVHTFSIINTNDVILIFFFFITSLIASTMTVRFQKQVRIAQQNEHTAQLLHELSSSYVNATGKNSIIRLGIDYLQEHTGHQSAVHLLDEPISEELSKGIDYEITGISRQIGILRIFAEKKELSEEQQLLIKTAANQMGIALDRELVYQEQERIKLEMEREHMRSSMLRSISHDFRTPLTGIIGDCGLLLNQPLDKLSVRQLAQDIDEQAMWLMKMMENILNLTKLESGKLELNQQMEVVEDIIYEAASHVIGLRKNRQFEVVLPTKVAVIKADGRLMVQVIANLLDNAMRHTKANGRIVVKVDLTDTEVEISVVDDGEGIDEELLPKLFEEFVTSSFAKSDHQRGIGLGLAICKAAVEAHGGTIHAENLKQGACFKLVLKREGVRKFEQGNDSDCRG